MPVPKYKTSKSKRDTRRSHHALSPLNSAICPNCNSVKIPHRVCESCGFYRGRQVMEPRSSTKDFATDFDTNA